ncbi:hypothetical protein HAL013_04600 [Helicobacter ailurogastricus]|uniref:Uncharacterized protein n=1 Tax=Helicobacter ailurogastricus TaxID=1578720 RepID=A0A0K2X3Y4_9HELI|nr:hypothetical protein HAL011_07780 [Helicobacter ailurogastricus]CRF42291.1 hypothetical protein HAL013_04600 [Helicobacter ailurogastricus]CRF44811.1 hypothetical protein HAL09_14230 [Helicobacter ailurogastricus]
MGDRHAHHTKNGKSDCLSVKDLPIGKPSTSSLVGAALTTTAAAYGLYNALTSDKDKRKNK